ncbi:hypothetical protein COCNU_01G014080 [Cocos nucifera]|uniref:Uncharacterized protein n=1 Tax=Cocos nucifera TaxID=13894 RepID=A0A8K0MV99_COCNU|nr:hypothetical protein COCNU_01G014080 [Cocos nucifera]
MGLRPLPPNLHNIFYLGAYQDIINKSDIPNLSSDNAVEHDSLVYRSYIALSSYQLVISEIDSSAPTALQAIKLLALYLAGDKLLMISEKITVTSKEAIASTQDVLDGSDSQDNVLLPDDVSIDGESSCSRNHHCPRDPIPSESIRRVRSQSRVSELEDAIRSLAEANQTRNNMMMQEHIAATSSSGQYSLANCIKVLESIEEVTMPTYLKTIKKLQDKRWRETFIEMSSARSDVEMEIDSKVEKNLNTSNSSDGEQTKFFYLFDEKEDDAIELVVTAIVKEYYNLYLCKQPY